MNSDTKRLIGKQKFQDAISYNLEWFGYEETIQLCKTAINRLVEMQQES